MKSLLTKKNKAPAKPDLQPHYTGMVKGSKDPTRPACVLVPLDRSPRHPSFRKVAERYCPPRTYYRFDKEAKRVQCLVSVMADGLHVAWDTCGGCAWYWSLCRCANGLRAPRSVEYIFDHINAVRSGEEWDHNHPLYRGSFTKLDRDAAARRQEARWGGSAPYRAPIPTTTTNAPAKGRSATQVAPKRLSKTDVPAKRTLTRATDADQVFDQTGNLDMAKLDDAASNLAKSLTKISKTLNKNATPTGKRLTKKGK